MILKGVRGKTAAAAELSMEKKKVLLVKAFEKYLIVTKVCAATRIPRNTFYRYLRDDPAFKSTIEECTEIFLDEAEDCLRKGMKEGSIHAAMFILKTRGKHRGYVEKQEIDHTSAGKPLAPVVTITFHDSIDIDRIREDM